MQVVVQSLAPAHRQGLHRIRHGHTHPGSVHHRTVFIRGFTLLELMAVIALIGTLSALLLPAISKAKKRVATAVCSNNLRQWGLATMLYVTDHEDFLPPDGSPNPGNSTTNQGWYIQLPRQLNLPPYHSMPWRTNANADTGLTVWLCPANERRSNGRNLFHYCLNSHIDGTGGDDRPVRIGALQEVSSLVWLFDSKNLPAVGYWNYTHTNLHSDGANFLFLDGHVRRFHRQDYWDETTNRGRAEASGLRWIP